MSDRRTDNMPEAPKRPKMPREQRAKQFMPFMPLESYPAALRERELKVEAEMELKLENPEITEQNL